MNIKRSVLIEKVEQPTLRSYVIGNRVTYKHFVCEKIQCQDRGGHIRRATERTLVKFILILQESKPTGARCKETVNQMAF